MVYAGLINKNIVATLQKNGFNSIGFSGADANVIPAHKRPVKR
jgi:acetylglutamate kinase